MPAYAAFLRAVNVGGTGKLPMSDLKNICEKLRFESVQTYIASGNVVFNSSQPVEVIKSELEASLTAYSGKPVGVHVRTLKELKQILSENPFPEVPGNRHMIVLLEKSPTAEMIKNAKFISSERLHVGERALHIHYPEGQGVSRVKVPGTEQGTSRNRNTIEKIIEMLGEG